MKGLKSDGETDICPNGYQRRSYPLRRQLLQEKPGLTDEKVMQLVHQSDRPLLTSFNRCQ